MKAEFKTSEHIWLNKLYTIREKWCCAFGKDYFSAGVLSSQRSESTNHSICQRMNKTTGLCDFYHIFGTVVNEWRSKERMDNAQCWDGVPEVTIPCKLLQNSAKVYTIAAFKRLEKEFLKGVAYKHELQMEVDNTLCYKVSNTSTDEFHHFVTYDSHLHYSSCTCKRFTESGFLCRHILRIYHCHNVEEIPSVYILKRWTKDAKPKEDATETVRGKTCGPVWRLDMHRKFHKLIIACVGNEKAREVLNECFMRARAEIEAIMGGVAFSEDEEGEHNGSQADVIQNPKGKTKKGERFTRKRSVIDIETSKARGKFKSAETRAKKRAATDSAKNKAAAPAKTNAIPQHMGLRQILMTLVDYTT